MFSYIIHATSKFFLQLLICTLCSHAPRGGNLLSGNSSQSSPWPCLSPGDLGDEELVPVGQVPSVPEGFPATSFTPSASPRSVHKTVAGAVQELSAVLERGPEEL